MQLKFFHDVKCIIFIIEVLLLSPFINNFFGIILTYSTNHDILYHKSHWTCRLIANLLQKWLVITVRPTTSVKEKSTKEATAPQHTRFILPPFHPTKSSLRCVGGIFLFQGRLHLKNFMSRPNEILRHDLTLSVGEPDNAAAKQGQELRSGQPAILYTSSDPLLIFAS